MEILKYLDVLIGLAVVMVLLSPLVAGLTQFALWIAGARSKRLQAALENLILTLNRPGGEAATVFTAAEATSIARSVQLHPMIGKPPFLIFKERPGDVVEREEFIRILLEFARDADSPVKEKLRDILRANDIADPAATLAAIRNHAQAMELREKPLPGHERLAKAIVTAASGAFTGKINTWFDQVMERTSGEYRFRAQLITVVAAGLVAFVVQVDSIDLLKRLSTDDKLRDSLVKQAQDQETRLEQQASAQPSQRNADELELARARRDEIEGNLAKLRDPQLGLLPDHFVWQALPRARLMRNPDWAPPYPRRLELVVGAGVYPIEPRWTADPLSDIEGAIRNSAAPVALTRDWRRLAIVHGPGVEKLKGATVTSGLAQAEVVSPVAAGHYLLIAGYAAPVSIQVGAKGDVRAAIEDSNAAVSTVRWPMLTAVDHEARWIELRRRAEDPASNVLKPAGFFGSTAYLPSADGAGAEVEFLVLTSGMTGALQLRSAPGHAESNMLDGAPELSCDSWVCIDWPLLGRTWRGVVLTWVLLSLGAPFWYDALKDLLKLRSSMAEKEEKARASR